jgi:hypothetical protein
MMKMKNQFIPFDSKLFNLTSSSPFNEKLTQKLKKSFSLPDFLMIKAVLGLVKGKFIEKARNRNRWEMEREQKEGKLFAHIKVEIPF